MMSQGEDEQFGTLYRGTSSVASVSERLHALVRATAAHGALPRRAPSTRCTAESMHHVWHRYKRPPTPSTAAPRADRAARTGCAKGCESCSAASSCRRSLEPTRAVTYYLTLTRWTYYVTSPQVVGILAGGYLLSYTCQVA